MKIILEVAILALVLSMTDAIPTPYGLFPTTDLFGQHSFQSHPLPGIIPANQQDRDLAHPAVAQNAAAEAQLSPELLNPFYKNPSIAAGLAKASWFGYKEFPVYHREADRISREEIYKIINRLQK